MSDARRSSRKGAAGKGPKKKQRWTAAQKAAARNKGGKTMTPRQERRAAMRAEARGAYEQRGKRADARREREWEGHPYRDGDSNDRRGGAGYGDKSGRRGYDRRGEWRDDRRESRRGEWRDDRRESRRGEWRDDRRESRRGEWRDDRRERRGDRRDDWNNDRSGDGQGNRWDNRRNDRYDNRGGSRPGRRYGGDRDNRYGTDNRYGDRPGRQDYRDRQDTRGANRWEKRGGPRHRDRWDNNRDGSWDNRGREDRYGGKGRWNDNRGGQARSGGRDDRYGTRGRWADNRGGRDSWRDRAGDGKRDNRGGYGKRDGAGYGSRGGYGGRDKRSGDRRGGYQGRRRDDRDGQDRSRWSEQRRAEEGGGNTDRAADPGASRPVAEHVTGPSERGHGPGEHTASGSSDDRSVRERDNAPRHRAGERRGGRDAVLGEDPHSQYEAERLRRVERPRRVEIPDDPSEGFQGLGVPMPIVERLARDGIAEPFPIQTATIPDAIAGRDVLGRGRTGSGKTMAFGIPTLTRLAGRTSEPNHPRAVILSPTRELAMQIGDALGPLAREMNLTIRLVAGGMPYEPQIAALARGVDVLVATPGRINDLVEKGSAVLDQVEIFVLDEADLMADMGFMPDVTALLDLVPEGGQRLLFSATLDKGVDELVEKYLTDPVIHSTDEAKASVATMSHHIFLVEPKHKKPITGDIANRPGRTVVFTRTKLGADRVARQLREQGVFAIALHGGLNQGMRNRILAAFKDGRLPVLVATDVASRGIHVDDVSAVLQVDPPKDHKDYLHRAGRTARAGSEGVVVTLALPHQRKLMKRIADDAGLGIQPQRVDLGDSEIIEATGASRPSGVPIPEEQLRAVTDPPRRPRYRRGGGPGGGYGRGYQGGYKGRGRKGGYRGGKGGYRGKPGGYRGRPRDS